MKKVQKFLLLLVFLGGSIGLFAQDPPPPPATHGAEGNQGPSEAPIDGGLGILLALGAGYGGYKLYRHRKKLTEESAGAYE